jgi:hypothetical protein
VAGIGHSEPSPQEPAPEHDTSHEHESEHRARRRHEPAPLQVTSQGPLLHRISSPQLELPVHWTSHDVAVPQRMWCAHALSPQTTRHGRFAGHCTSERSQLPLALQSITQTPAASHVPFVQPSWHREVAGLLSTRLVSPPSTRPGTSQAPCPGMAHHPSRQC